MGANATTFVPAYVSGEVLTAADLTVTNSGIPVFADLTARTAAFGGTGEKVLAEGQYAYLESDNSTSVWDGAAWQLVGASALVRIGGGTLSGSSVAFNNVFSATYDNYLVSVSNLTAAGNFWMTLQLGATTTGYYSSSNFTAYGASTSTFNEMIYGGASGSGGVFTISNPFLAKRTVVSGVNPQVVSVGSSGIFGGFLDNTTSYTGFTLAGTTFTAGTVNVYGYVLS